MERLAQALSAAGLRTDVFQAYTPERWRKLMASGAFGRLQARLVASVCYPFSAVANALFSSAKTVVATTNPFFLPFVLTATRHLHRKPVIALVYDLYPDALEASGLVERASIGTRAGSWMNRFVMRRADGVVFIGEHMAEHAKTRYGRPKVEMIAVTGASRAEHTGVSVQQDFRPEGGVLLSYVGNLGKMHDWETVAGGLPRVLGQNVRFVCAASGPGEPIWSAKIGSAVDGTTDFIGPLPDEPWRQLLAETDISLVTLRREAVHTSIPSKLFSAMAAGCAIVAVAPERSDLASVIRREQCGIVVEPGDPDELANELQRLCEDRDRLAKYKQAAVDAVENHYDIARLAERWKLFIGTILSE